MADTKEFFRFYEERDGFEETRPMYEKVIGALAESGYIPEQFVVLNQDGTIDRAATLDRVIEECREIDDAEASRADGKIKEENIGLYGFMNKYYIKDVRDQAESEVLAASGHSELSPDEKKIVDRRESVFLTQIGSAALGKIPEDSSVPEDERESHYEAKAFIGELAAGPYFPRQTCASAAHFMGHGRIMQIGCSQGKTSVVAMTTYEQARLGKKVFSTSSSPGLVPENYDEARGFYELMGVAEDFCAISQNPKDNIDHIVLFHNGKKYEVRSDNQVWVETEVDGQTVMSPIEYTPEDLFELGIVPTVDGKIDFEASVRDMMANKNIIMGDTITLGKYQHLMPQRNSDGIIEGSFLIVDEADAELLDTQPQELLGKEYKGAEAEKRKADRVRARDFIKEFKGEPSELIDIAKREGIPLDFLIDAYEAQTKYSNPEQYTVRDGKIFILNPNTNVMIPASQGLAQAILANDETLGTIPEMEVLGETDIPQLFSNFEVASLMSGTMQDKGITQEEMTESYKQARINFFQKCGPGVALAASHGVMDWRLITPLTRDEKGSVIVTSNGITRHEKDALQLGEDIETTPEEITEDWDEYLETHGSQLEDKWRESVRDEALARSKTGRPVMVSVYGGRNPMEAYIDHDGKEVAAFTDPVSGEPVESYTDKNQIGGHHQIGDSKCLFSRKVIQNNLKDEKPIESRVGEVAVFDDFYGRGYTFKFAEMDEKGNPVKEAGKDKPVKSEQGGHVLITSLPQNSRNLEQFLFRVARGGDKGSSSIIISPSDPVLVDYLKRLEKEQGKEAANDYFKKVMRGEIEVDQIVKDIYPRETEEILQTKAELAGARELYAELETIGSLEKSEASSVYTTEFKKQTVTYMKYYRLAGAPKDPITTLVAAERLRGSVLQQMQEQGIETPKAFQNRQPNIKEEIFAATQSDTEYNALQASESIELIKAFYSKDKAAQIMQNNPPKIDKSTDNER